MSSTNNVRIGTLIAAVLAMTPEVVNPRFSNEIAGCSLCRDRRQMMKASRKWLAFNDFYSGGRIRTSDLRVMSVISTPRATS